MRWGCPFDSKSLLRGVVLPILQMEKLRLRKLESDPKAPHYGARVLGVCMCVCALVFAHRRRCRLLSVPGGVWAGMSHPPLGEGGLGWSLGTKSASSFAGWGY